MDTALQILLFIFHGLLGAVLAELLKAKAPKTLVKWSAAKHYFIGIISGYIYWWLHSEYNFPNAFMAIVFGYFSKDLLEKIFEMFRKKMLLGGE